jgi:hypothetical protein
MCRLQPYLPSILVTHRNLFAYTSSTRDELCSVQQIAYAHSFVAIGISTRIRCRYATQDWVKSDDLTNLVTCLAWTATTRSRICINSAYPSRFTPQQLSQPDPSSRASGRVSRPMETWLYMVLLPPAVSKPSNLIEVDLAGCTTTSTQLHSSGRLFRSCSIDLLATRRFDKCASPLL